MSVPTTRLAPVAARMRREFDDAFAQPLTASADRELILKIQLAGEPFAVRLSDVIGIAKLRRIATLPSALPGLLGITAIRGAVFPAYDLAALLALPPARTERGWILLAGSNTPVGLVFDRLGGQLEIERTNFYENDPSTAGKHLRQVAAIADIRLPVIQIPDLVREIRRNAGLEGPAKE